MTPILRAAAVLLCLGSAFASGPAAAQSTDELRARIARLEGEMRALRSDMGGPAGAPAGGNALVRLGEMEEELRRLTGDVERLRYRIDQIAQDATRRFGDIEFRLTELEGGDIAALGQVPPVGGGAAAETGPAVSVSERVELDRAIAEVQQGRLDQAEDRLLGFIDQYPDSPLVGEARYWLGESLFTRGLFGEAARNYLAGYDAGAEGEMGALNLMKLGVTLGRLGQVREACLTLREVATRYPAQGRIVSEAEGEAERLACG